VSRLVGSEMCIRDRKRNIRFNRVIGWLGALEGDGLRKEAKSFGAMLDVVVERGVEGAELFLWHEREDGSSQKSQVFGSFGFAPHTSVLAPAGGIAPPVVFVFH
jgi:hypothetical protein